MACNATEPNVVHARVDHLRLPCRWTITQAVVRRAQVRAAFDYFARNAELCLRGIVTLGWRDNARIDCRPAARLDDFVGGAWCKPITSPFPYVTPHIVQTATALRQGSDRGISLVAVPEHILPA